MSLKTIINKFTGEKQYVVDETTLPSVEGLNWKAGVANEAALPSEGNSTNDARITSDTHHLYIWSGSAWVDQGDIFDINWGSIGGTLADQTDLKDALDAKADQADLTSHENDTNNPHSVTFGDVADVIKGASDLLTDNTVLLVNFNGDSPMDLSGNDLTLTLGSESSLVSNETPMGYGKCMYVPTGYTVDNGLKIHNDTILSNLFTNSVGKDWTIEYRVKGAALDIAHTILVLSTDGAPYYQHFLGDSGLSSSYDYVIYDSLGEVGRQDADILNTNNTWFDISITHVGSSGRSTTNLYVNGTLIGNISTLGISLGANNLWFGGLAGDVRTSHGGDMHFDLLRISDKILTTDEMIHNFSSDVIDEGNVLSFDSDDNIVETGNSVSDLSDSITKKHTQNSDTILDEGGSNEISAANIVKGAIEFVVDGGGSEITTGRKLDLQIPFPCTIESVVLLSDQDGSIQIDVWKTTYDNYDNSSHPVDGDSITASAVPAISSASKSKDETLAEWTPTITEGDILTFYVDSCTTITRCTMVLKIKRT